MPEGQKHHGLLLGGVLPVIVNNITMTGEQSLGIRSLRDRGHGRRHGRGTDTDGMKRRLTILGAHPWSGPCYSLQAWSIPMVSTGVRAPIR